MRRSGLKRPWDLAVIGLAAVLLLSMGGAIVAAPLTLPLLYLAARRDEAARSLRAAAVVVAAFTVAEVAWAATYLGIGEAQPWIWLVPVAAGSAAGALFASQPVELAAV